MTSLFNFTVQEPRFPQAMVTELVEYDGQPVSLLEFAPVDLDPATHESEESAVATEEFAVNERARQVAVMIEAARDAATHEARERFSEQQDQALERERARVEGLCAEFARDRRQYFAAAERQAVRLALAIARKILVREADADPMLLSGSVKAALSKVQDGSVSRLFVSAGQAEAWRALLSRAEGTFEVRESDALEVSSMRLETSVGEVELGIRTQLEEIERELSVLFAEQAA